MLQEHACPFVANFLLGMYCLMPQSGILLAATDPSTHVDKAWDQPTRDVQQAAKQLLPLQARSMLKFADDNASTPPVLRPLKLYATKWHSALGFTLALAVALPQLVPQIPF